MIINMYGNNKGGYIIELRRDIESISRKRISYR